MKKFSFAFATMLTLVLGVVLSACTFKTPEAVFSAEEIVISLGEEVNLNEYLSTNEVEKSEVEFAFSNSSFFSVNDGIVTPTSHGQTNVYAVLNGNSLASTKLIVKKQFESVANIQMNDEGVLSWNRVIDRFDETENFTSPSEYLLEMEFENIETGETSSQNLTISTNSYQLVENGRYTISLTALGEGKFDSSTPTTETIYLGYMPQLAREDFSFNSETSEMTWSNVAGADYSVYFNNQLLSEHQIGNSYNLTSNLESLPSNTAYSFSVVVHDADGDEDERISVQSEEVEINKIESATATPTFSTEEGGYLSFNLPENSARVAIYIGEEEFSVNSNTPNTTFEGLEFGKHYLEYRAIGRASDTAGVFYANSSLSQFGYIYKLSPLEISGRGENEPNGTSFNYHATTEDSVSATNFRVLLNGEFSETHQGFLDDTFDTDTSCAVNEAGEYSLVAYNIPTEQRVIFEDDDCVMINSNQSNALSFVKLSAFSEFENGETIQHSYQDGNSQISFNLVENADTYSLYIENSGEDVLVENSLYTYLDGTFTFNGRLEDVLEVEDEVTLKVVAQREDDLTTISSMTTKTLSRLETPTSESGNSTDITYTWSAVDGAENYLVKYAIITKQQFEGGVESLGELSLEETTSNSNSIDLVGGNYYYIEIVANPSDELNYLSSQRFQNVFYISKYMDKPTLNFGFNEDFIGDLTGGTGYFINIHNVENLESIIVQIGEEVVPSYSIGENETNYRFTQSFDDGALIEITLRSTDPTIYLDTVYTLEVIKLASVNYYDLSFDELTTTLTLSGGREGVTEIRIYDVNSPDDQTITANTDAEFPITNITNTEIAFLLKGSVFEDNLFEIVDDKVYLDSDLVTFNVRRLANSTEFAYRNGDLVFEAGETRSDGHFVLDMFMQDVNSNETKVTVHFENEVRAVIDSETISLSGNYLSNIDSSYTIDFELLLANLMENATFASIYNQTLEVEFGLYYFNTSFQSGVIYLSSKYATLKSDASQNLLTIQKMASPTITYDRDSNSIVWSAIGESAETTYSVINLNTSETLSTTPTASYRVDLSSLTLSLDHRFAVSASNPEFLESGLSNEIILYLLSPIREVKLSENTIQVSPSTLDAGYIASVGVQIESTEESFEQISGEAFNIAITSSGEYVLRFIGNDGLAENGRYILNSETSTFTLQALSNLAPANTNITYSESTISFERFGEEANLQSLSYRLVFTDSTGNTARIHLTDNSYSISELSELNPLNPLVEGEITIDVYAVLDTYNVSSGGIVYFNNVATTIDKLSTFNAYTYTQTSINKLTSPTITNIEFVYTGSEDGTLSDAMLRPDMQITVTASYSENETLLVYFGDHESYVAQEECDNSGTYTITIPFETYSDYLAVGEGTNVIVYGTSTVNLPSSSSYVTVHRNSPLLSISQNADEEKFNNLITISFASPDDLQYATGGVILKITYTPNDEGVREIFYQIPSSNYLDDGTITYDLTSFFAENMEMGGIINYSAFINNFSADGKYCLSSEMVYSAQYQILTSPNFNDNIAIGNGGITIGNTINTANTEYIISYTDETGAGSITIGSAQNYFFEYPDVWATGMEYTLTITAMENGYISSVPSVLEVSMNRLSRVQNVVLSRDELDNSLLTLSWDVVNNASSYRIRAYVTGEEEVFVGEATVTDTDVSMNEIFGDNYASLSSYITLGANMRFEIVSCSDNPTYTNSSIRYVSATFLANTLSPAESGEDFMVSPDGQLYFATAIGERYLYRILSTAGNALTAWQEVEGYGSYYVVELSNVDEITTQELFRLQVVMLGNATTDGISYNYDSIELILDSAYVSSERTFRISPPVHSVGINVEDNSKFTVSLESENSKLYVNTENSFSLGNFVNLNIDQTNYQVDGAYYVFNVDTSTIFDNYDIAETGPLYFYVLQTSEEHNYIISKPYEFEFLIDNSSAIKDVRKITEGDDADLTKTYIVFDQTSPRQIVGFNLKIEFSNGDETYVSKVALNSDECIINEEANEISFNLTDILRRESVDHSYGVYKLYISVIKAEGENIYFSNYITDFNDRELEFTKILEAERLYLSGGNINWDVNEAEEHTEMVEKFYIYATNVDDENLYNIYETKDNSQRSLDASYISGDNSAYYISIVLVNSDPWIIASNPKYVETAEGELQEVVRNKFNSLLTLNSNGELSIDWNSNSAESTEENDIYKLLTMFGDLSAINSTTANQFVNSTFEFPFTMNITDLVNNQILVQLKFTSYRDIDKTEIAFQRTVQINAIYLLQNLEIDGVDFDAVRQALTDSLTSGEDDRTVNNFFNILESEVGGVGNYINIFDFAFEAVQAGRYEIEYCLVGGTSTLTSRWYKLTKENDSGEEVEDFYVNQSVTVTAGRESDTSDPDGATNAYYLLINRANIYTEDGSTTPATRYFMQIVSAGDEGLKYGVEISTTDGNSWNAILLNQDGATSFSVQSVDEDADGVYDYLKLYLNMNGGNSLLGRYGEILPKNDYRFEIFAQGNDFSISSKSTNFSLVFLSACQNFAVTDGVFSWTAYQNTPTRVIYKHSESTNSSYVNVSAISESTAMFSLENLSAGRYDYLKFVVFGGIEGNEIRVDSEVYILTNVYKLSNPSLTSDLNNFVINDSANAQNYGSTYSADGFMKYEVSNNNSATLSYRFQTDSTRSTYEAGTTGYVSSDTAYDYKSTEEHATSYNFSSLGSTASFSAVLNASVANRNTYTLLVSDQGAGGRNISLKSNVQTIDARMLQPVSDIAISEGMVNWNGDAVYGDLIADGQTVIYKVAVQFYEETYTSTGTANSNVGSEIVRYTQNTFFDFSDIEEFFPEEIVGKDYKAQITIQALSLFLSDTLPSGNSVSLVEGGYAYGANCECYYEVDGERRTYHILRSNGNTAMGIEFSPSVENLSVIDGRITWTYSLSSTETATFIVEDEEGNMIVGEIYRDGNTYTFTEDNGELNGEHTINVYAIKSGANLIKSRARTLDIFKLSPIEAEDYSINPDSFEVITENFETQEFNFETLDFANYFNNKNNASIDVRLRLTYQSETAQQVSVELSRDMSQIIILRNMQEYQTLRTLMQIYSEVAEIVNNFASIIIIEDNLDISVFAYNGNEEENPNVVSSDVYETTLKRPVNDYLIEWDEETQTFSWSNHLSDTTGLTYILDVTYSTGIDSVTRRYETSAHEFTPTIISNVRFTLTVRNENGGLQSESLTYTNEEDMQDFVEFNLFAGGDGTSEKPYLIETAEQFENIQYRAVKSSDVISYYTNGGTYETEEEIYHFSIQQNISGIEFEGLLVSGSFTGVIAGNQHTISYTATGVEALTSTLSIGSGENRIPSLTSGTSTTTYSYGAGLFEILTSTATSTASISDLTVEANFVGVEAVEANLLVGGIAIDSSGSISNVNISGFNSTLVVYEANSRLIGAYAGITAMNRGTVESCAVISDITLSDSSSGTTYTQNFFIGGLVFTNYSTISNSRVNANITLNLSSTSQATHQLAGITVASTVRGSVRDNSVAEGCQLTISCPEMNGHVGYIAGISCYARGTTNGNTATSCVQGVNFQEGNLTAQDTFIPV